MGTGYFKNKAYCSKCGEFIESMFRHGFAICDCEGQAMVDGGVGNGYTRIGGTAIPFKEEITEEEFPRYKELNPSLGSEKEEEE